METEGEGETEDEEKRFCREWCFLEIWIPRELGLFFAFSFSLRFLYYSVIFTWVFV